MKNSIITAVCILSIFTVNALFANELSFRQINAIIKERVHINEDIDTDNAHSEIRLLITKKDKFTIKPIKGNPKLVDVIIKQLDDQEFLKKVSMNCHDILICFEIQDWRKGSKEKATKINDSLYVSRDSLHLLENNICKIFYNTLKLGEKFADLYDVMNKKIKYPNSDIWEKDRIPTKIENLKLNNIPNPNNIKFFIRVEENGTRQRIYDMFGYKDTSFLFQLIDIKASDTIFKMEKIGNTHNSISSLEHEYYKTINFFKCLPSPPEYSLALPNGTKYKIFIYEDGYSKEIEIISPCAIAETNGIVFYEKICLNLNLFIMYFHGLE